MPLVSGAAKPCGSGIHVILAAVNPWIFKLQNTWNPLDIVQPGRHTLDLESFHTGGTITIHNGLYAVDDLGVREAGGRRKLHW